MATYPFTEPDLLPLGRDDHLPFVTSCSDPIGGCWLNERGKDAGKGSLRGAGIGRGRGQGRGWGGDMGGDMGAGIREGVIEGWG